MVGLRVKLATGIAVLGVGAVAAAAVAGDGEKLRTELSGFEEAPAILTTGEGSFHARISRSGEEIEYRLEYAGLEGGTTPTMAHIHIGQPDVSGGISAWLCGSTTNPGPAGTQSCPVQPGTVTGTIRPANVVGPDGQGVAPGEFAELVRAIRSGVAYANVHTTKYGGGEIRGQIGKGGDNDHDD